MRRVTFIAVVWLCAGCGDDDAPPTFDAGALSDAADAATSRDLGSLFTPPDIPWLDDGTPPVASPDIPWLDEGTPPIASPTFGPCAGGWRAHEDADAIEVCDPGGAVELDGCARPDEGRLPGADTCTRVGAACPVGPWADDLPTDVPVVFALAGAAPDGDGTRERPFATIREALAATPAGGTVAIAKGTYDEAVSMTAGRTLRGACAAETIVTSSSASPDTGVIAATRLRDVVEVRDLRIADSPRPGISVIGEHASLVLSGVVIEDVVGIGVFVSEGSLVATDIVVRGVASASDGRFGHALAVLEGEVDVARASFERGHGVSVLAALARRVSLTDVSVLDTESFPDRTFGIGISIEDGSTVTLSRVVIARSRMQGLYIAGPAATLDAEHVVVRDTRSQERDMAGGSGFVVLDGATATARAMVLEGSRESGVLVASDGASLELSDAVVRDTASRDDGGSFGRGIGVERGGRLGLRRALLARNHEAGIVVARPDVDGTPPSAVIEDVVVSDTDVEEATGALGHGAQVADTGTLELRRVLLDGNRETGLLVAVGAAAQLEDVVVRDTRPRPDGVGGRGLSVEQGGVVDGIRVLVDHCADAAFSVIDQASRITLTDVVARDTDVEELGGIRGQGLSAQLGGTAEITRALFERNHSEGVLATDPTTRVTLVDVVVRDTQARPSDRELGHGMQAQLGARMDAERVSITRNRGFGVVVYGAEAILVARDLSVVDTAPSDADGLLGHGIQVEEHASAELDRVLVRGSRERGLVGWLATIVLRDAVIDDTRSSAMAGTVSGIGLSATEAATVSATRFSVGESVLCGVQVTSAAELDLEDGEVFGSTVGACVQVDGYDLGRLSSRVVYRDNGVNLQATTHPPPRGAALDTED